MKMVDCCCRYRIDFNDESKIESFDEMDGFMNKVKKAKHVGEFSGDIDTIGELTISTRQRPAAKC